MNNTTRLVRIGGFANVGELSVGGGAPVAVQTMWKDSLTPDCLEGGRGEGIAARIEGLHRMGCGLLRFAVPDMAGAEALGALAGAVSMPLAADIQFDYRIALRCLDFPIAKIRLNPGNIGGGKKARAVLEKAASRSRPIRIGVNAGSLPQDLRREAEAGRVTRAEALVRAAERELALCAECGFTNVVVSMKASSVSDTIEANRLLSERTDAPLHTGVTEAGPRTAGVARNTAALLTLLAEGIGDTIRVSLSDSMEEEVIAGREILAAAAETAALREGPNGAAAARLKRHGVRIVSCPRCGRNGFDTIGFTRKWQDYLYGLDKDITVAIMGCAVNGPGEARHADLGITGAGDKVLIFRKGKVIRAISASEADDAFRSELDSFSEKSLS